MKNEFSKAISLRLPSDALAYLHHGQEGRRNIKINVTGNGITIVIGNKVYPINVKKVDTASHMYKNTGSSNIMYHTCDISHEGTLGEPSMIKEPTRKLPSAKTNENIQQQQQKRERLLDEEDKRDFPDTKKLKKPASKRPASVASAVSAHNQLQSTTVRETYNVNTESPTKNNNSEKLQPVVRSVPASASHSTQTQQHSTAVSSGPSQSKIKNSFEKLSSSDISIKKTSSVDAPLRKVKNSEVSGKRPSSLDQGSGRSSNTNTLSRRHDSIEPSPKRKHGTDLQTRRPSNVDTTLKRSTSTDSRTSKDSLRKEVIHMLALNSASTRVLCRKLNVESQSIMPILNEVALPVEDQWHLYPIVHTELNIWEWPGYSEKNRRTVIQNTKNMYDKAMKLSPDAPERANLIFPTTPRSSRPNSGQQNTSNNSSPLKDKNLLTIPKKRDHSKDENYGKQGLMGSVRRRSDQPGYSNGNERQKSSKKIEERVDPKKSASTKSSLGGIKATKESREVSTRSVSPASMPKQSKPSKLKSTALTSTKISEPKLETPTLTPTPTPTLTLTPTPAQSSIILSPSPTKLTVSENLHLKSSSKISAKIPIPTKTPGNTPTPTKVITPTKFTEFTKTLPSQKIPMSSKMASPVKELVKVPSKKPAKLSVRAPTPPSKNQVSQSPSIVPTLTPSAVPLPMATNVTPPQPSNTTTTPRYSSKSVVGWEKPPNEDTSNYDVSSNCFPQPYRAPIVNSQTQFSKLCLEHKKAQEEVKLLNETIDEQCPIIHEMLTKSSVEVGPKDDVIVKLKAVFLDLEGHPEDWRYVVYIVKRLFWLRQKLELLYSIITTAHGLQGYIIPEDV